MESIFEEWARVHHDIICANISVCDALAMNVQDTVEYLSHKVEYFINREEFWPIVMAKQGHDDEDNVRLRIIDKVMKNRCARISWVFEFLWRSKIKQNVELPRQSLCLFNADLLIVGDAVRCVCRKPLAQIS